VFLGAVPLLATMILLIWMSQILGMLDVGRYLLSLERDIREALTDTPEELMTWEQKISTQSALSWPPNYAWHYLAVLGLFGLLTLASIVLGAYRGFADHEQAVTITAVAVSLVIVAVFTTVGAAVVRARARNRIQAEAGSAS